VCQACGSVDNQWDARTFVRTNGKICRMPPVPANHRPASPIAAPFVVAPPAGARIRTRLRVSPQDARVLRALGGYLGRLAGQDLTTRCRLGHGPPKRTARKRALTACSSSRWAGTLTRTSEDQWQRARRNLMDTRVSWRRAIRVIERRLAVPVGGRCGKTRGYPTRQERWAKQQRLQHLQVRLARAEHALQHGRVSVVRGGRRLLRSRHHLAVADLTEQQWRARWQAERLFLTADGDAEYPLGNGTIMVHPEEGWLEVKLPGRLGHLANRPHGYYRLSCPVRFSYRADEWAAQAVSGAVRYDLGYDPDRDRWYAAASWTAREVAVPTLEAALAGGVLAVDLNAGHLACWKVDHSGNPVGSPTDIPLVLDGLPASTRDGRLRAAICALLDLVTGQGCSAVGVENLNFTDARQTGRETLGRGRRGKRFRRVAAGIPTSQFRDRLAQMAANRGIAVVAMDPGWTSKWGAVYWQRPLQAKYPRTQITRHHAACVVLGRRALGRKARRRSGVPAPHQRMEAAPMGAGAESNRPGRARVRVRAGHDPPATRLGSPTQEQKTGSGDRTRLGAQAAHDRSVPPVSGHPHGL
jgi:hypothetical protein